MRVVIVHDRVAPGAPPDEADALVQAEAVRCELVALGHETSLLPLSLDLARVRNQLADLGAERVFNLVESVEGKGRLILLAPALFESIPLGFTGSGSTAVLETSNKVLAKRRMASAGLPTPAWFDLKGPHADAPDAGTFILKAIWEHASRGLDDSSVVTVSGSEDRQSLLRAASQRLGDEAFGEQFVEGREFNLALLESADGSPEVLPPAEIEFRDWDPQRPRLVGYAAKWDEESFEYTHTIRSFDFGRADAALLERLKSLATDCWRLFGLRGYARVDFRVDSAGRPWILEVNVNPCLSPAAGFAAALLRAGISFRAGVERILHASGAPDFGRSGRPDVLGNPGRRPDHSGLTFRHELRPSDPAVIRKIVESSGFFSASEVDVAEELARERLTKGPASGYHFVFAERSGEVVGYTCFGPIACTISSFDLYWIAVAQAERSRGVGRALLNETERLVIASGGSRLYAETSSRPQYAPTRAYYLRAGFNEDSRVEDFYGPADSKVIYGKGLG